MITSCVNLPICKVGQVEEHLMKSKIKVVSNKSSKPVHKIKETNSYSFKLNHRQHLIIKAGTAHKISQTIKQSPQEKGS